MTVKKEKNFFQRQEEAFLAARKQMSKKERRQHNVFLAVIALCLFLIIVCTVGAVRNGMKLHHLAQVQTSANKEAQDLATEQSKLKINISELHDPQYVQKLARARYFLSKDGEQIYVFPNNLKESQSTADSANTEQTLNN